MAKEQQTQEPEISLDTLAAEIGKGARLFRVFEHGEKVVARMQGLDQEVRNLEARVEQSRAKEAEARKMIDDIADKGAAIKAQAEADVQKAKDDAAQIIAQAQQDALNIINNANADAHANRAEADRLAGEITAKVAELEGIQRQIDEANKTIDEIQTKAAKVLGGLPKGAA